MRTLITTNRHSEWHAGHFHKFVFLLYERGYLLVYFRNNHYTQTIWCNVNSYNKDTLAFCKCKCPDMMKQLIFQGYGIFICTKCWLLAGFLCVLGHHYHNQGILEPNQSEFSWSEKNLLMWMLQTQSMQWLGLEMFSSDVTALDLTILGFFSIPTCWSI